MTILNYYATTTLKSWALGFVIFFVTLIAIAIIVKVIRRTLDKRTVRKHCDKIKRIAQENPIETKRGIDKSSEV